MSPAHTHTTPTLITQKTQDNATNALFEYLKTLVPIPTKTNYRTVRGDTAANRWVFFNKKIRQIHLYICIYYINVINGCDEQML